MGKMEELGKCECNIVTDKIIDISKKLSEKHDEILIREVVNFCNENEVLEYAVSIDMLKEALDLYIKIKEKEKFGKDINVPTKTPRWIPISERLPEEYFIDDEYTEPSDYVLVYGNYGDYEVSRYWGNSKSKKYRDWMDLKWITEKPIAWMELPKPYNSESEVEE